MGFWRFFVGTVWRPCVFSSLLVFAILWGGGCQASFLGGAYNRKRYGFLHTESKSAGRKPIVFFHLCFLPKSIHKHLL